MKKILILGVSSGILSGIAGIIYLKIYEEAFGTDYHNIINQGSIMGACVIGCMLIALANAALSKIKKDHYVGWLNITVTILSFGSIVFPLGMSLPLNIEYPELFPGLAIPMHFFPSLAFLTIYPFSIKKLKK